LAQLSLVEHSLCPLDVSASLVENLVHDAAYLYLDRNRHMRQAKARVIMPGGLSASDEFYLWGYSLSLSRNQNLVAAFMRRRTTVCANSA